MGTCKIICVGFLSASLLFGSALADSLEGKREQVAKVYSSQIGVREKTGNNDGAQVEKYLASVKLGKGYSWCAAFVHWVFQQSGVKTIQSGWVPAWFSKTNVIYVRGKPSLIPQKADAFGIWFPSKKRVAHIGFIDEWLPDKGICITVEGNTDGEGSREGDGVYRKRRLIRTIYCVSRWIN